MSFILYEPDFLDSLDFKEFHFSVIPNGWINISVTEQFLVYGLKTIVYVCSHLRYITPHMYVLNQDVVPLLA
jgi:hypothetical protein